MPKQPKQRQSTARRNPNGEGSIYQRSSDGRWVGQAYVLTTDGTRKRKFVYGATWDEAHAKLVELKSRSQRGIPVPDRAWKLADYLPYWLAAYVTDLKPTTARGYESAVRLHLIPALGSKRLDGLQVQHVKAFMDDFRRKCLCCTNGLDQIRPVDRRCCSVGRCCERYPSARQIQFVHAVLRNALQHAMREELVSRNVAKLVRVPRPGTRSARACRSTRCASSLPPPPATGSTPSTSWRPRWVFGAASWSGSAGRTSTWTKAPCGSSRPSSGWREAPRPGRQDRGLRSGATAARGHLAHSP